MTTPPPNIATVLPATPESIKEGEENLTSVNALAAEGKLSGAAVLDVQATTLRLLRRMTVDQPERSARALLTELLPIGLHEHDDDTRIDVELHLCRELAGEWITSLAAAGWYQLTQRALDYLRDQLRGSAIKTAAWSLAQTGLRTDSVVEALETILRADAGGAGDQALSALVDLGVPAERTPEYRAQLERRLRLRASSPLLHALQELADEHTLRKVQRDPPPGILTGMDPAADRLIWVLARVVARNPEPHLHDYVARIHQAIESEHPKTLANVFHISSQILPGCDSPLAIEILLALLGRWPAGGTEAARKHWLLFLRLQDCVKPRQLAAAVRLPRAARAAIEAYLFSPESADINVRPFSADIKNAALDAALRLALPGLENRLAKIVLASTDPFAREAVMVRFQSLVLPELPEFLKKLVTDPVNVDTASQSDVGWFQRIAATDLIANSANWEALEVLGNPGWLVDGAVLQPAADALSEVALALATDAVGAENVTRWLLNALEGTSAKARTYTVCCALAALASADRLPAALAGQLAGWCAEGRLEDFPRSELVRALGFLPAASLPTEMPGLLLELAKGPDGWLCWRALLSLARLGLLAAHPDLLEDRLGVRRSVHGWNWHKECAQVGESARIIGWLWAAQPEEFNPALLSLADAADWRQWNSLTPALDAAAERSHALPSSFEEALIARIKRHHTPYGGDAPLVTWTARRINGRFVQEPWDQCWENWLPDDRAHLANVLGDGDTDSNALRLLARLAKDENATVRRAAARGLGRVAPGLLLSRLAGQAEQGVPARVRVAGLLCWVPQTRRGAEWHTLEASLSVDRHPAVREAMATARGEDIRREWAREYCQRVIALTDGKNSAVLAVWRYGDALARTGDDESLDHLAAHLRAAKLPPNVRRWKVGVLKALKKSWDERRKPKGTHPPSFEACTEAGIGTLGPREGVGGLAVEYNLRCGLAPAGQCEGPIHGTLAAFGDSWPTALSARGAILTLENGRSVPVTLDEIQPGSFAVFASRDPASSADEGSSSE